MKINVILLSVFLSISSLTFGQGTNTIELPLVIENGYKPFVGIGFFGLNFYQEGFEDNPWQKTYLKIDGIPSDWTNIQQGSINTNIKQFVYQNYLSGDISKDFYENLKKSWNINEAQLSEKPLKCSIRFAVGTDSKGKQKVIVDRNNNESFSDDQSFDAIEIESDDNSSYESIQKDAICASIECLLNGSITTESIPLLIIKIKQLDNIMYSIPQYATTLLNGYKIGIVSEGFGNTSFNNIGIALMSDTNNESKISLNNTIRENEFITINNELFKNKGVIKNRNILILERSSESKDDIYSTQIGFKAIPIQGKEFTTQEPISLDTYKGKYLYIDFWAIWCGPCLRDFPKLKSLYDNLDKSKIEMLGIIGESPVDGAKMIVTNMNVTWPQILADDTNEIIKSYNINSYPSTLLIDPSGVIIGRNLNVDQLKDKIEELGL